MALSWTPGPFRWAFRWRPFSAGSSPTYRLWAQTARKLLEVTGNGTPPGAIIVTPGPRPTRRAVRSAQVPGQGHLLAKKGRSGLTGGGGGGAGGRGEGGRGGGGEGAIGGGAVWPGGREHAG